MDANRWNRFSAWHNAWLDATPIERQRLREQLAIDDPDLVPDVDAILAEGPALDGFLEVPAFVGAFQELAAEAPSLASGTAVGPYRIVELVARGGMGDVYRAADLRLNRDVALKVLTHAEHCDPRSIDRFQQEARMTASLDHPNVVKIYDVGSFGGRPYLVAEMLEGETLRSRSSRAIDPSEACRIAAAVARGLVAAHGAGLAHRDLKPENIFLTRAGETKILDFGIAKLVDREASPADGGGASTGALFGTAGYLAPEQIEGRAVDGRADLFSLGSILFEMLTGQRAFSRATTIDTLHAIVHDRAPDLLSNRADVPSGLAIVVWRLLEKNPDARFQSAADLAWTLERLSATPLETTQPVRAGRRSRMRLARAALLLSIAAAIGVATGGLWWSSRARPTDVGHVAQFTWTLPDGVTLESEPAVSPDGRRIVFVGASPSGVRLYVRELVSLAATPIRGTDGAKQPFWSPDSDAVGFFAQRRLKRVRIDGASAIDIAAAPDARGGSWSRSGVIVFQSFYRDSGLSRVSIDGGAVTAATVLDAGSGDTTHKWPVFLPDGDHFLYLQLSLDESRRGIFVGRLSAPAAAASRRLVRATSGALYVAPATGGQGRLLVAAAGQVESWPFDTDRLIITADPQTIPSAAAPATPHHAAMLGVSPGVLAYATTPVPMGLHAASVGVDGTGLSVRPEREISSPTRLSPAGTHVVRGVLDPLTGDSDVWVEPLTGLTRVRVTSSRDLDVSPVWSPDGRQIAYRSGPVGASRLAIASSDGTGVVKMLPCPGEPCLPSDWSAQGHWLSVNIRGDVWRIEVAAGSSSPLLDGKFVERDARISPDGQWVAYVSDESGRPEVYIRTLAAPLRRVVVSSGGDQPVWQRDGRRLFYVNGENELHAVWVGADRERAPVVGERVKLPIPRFGAAHIGTVYDVSPDGRHVYFAHPADAPKPREIGVVLNWSGLIKPRAE